MRLPNRKEIYDVCLRVAIGATLVGVTLVLFWFAENYDDFSWTWVITDAFYWLIAIVLFAGAILVFYVLGCILIDGEPPFVAHNHDPEPTEKD